MSEVRSQEWRRQVAMRRMRLINKLEREGRRYTRSGTEWDRLKGTTTWWRALFHDAMMSMWAERLEAIA